MSGPVWMYRKGEGKMFPSPEDVPVGEGWQDTPVPPAEPDEPDEAPAEPAPKRRGRPPKSEAIE